jgi:hypothetical protein
MYSHSLQFDDFIIKHKCYGVVMKNALKQNFYNFFFSVSSIAEKCKNCNVETHGNEKRDVNKPPII